jgi:hypothetical protein
MDFSLIICMRHLFAGALRNQYAFEPPQFYDPPKPRRSHVPPPVTKRSEIRPSNGRAGWKKFPDRHIQKRVASRTSGASN